MTTTVDVWLAPLDATADPTAGLSPRERERAAAFLRPEAARQWTSSHRALRRVLSTYLDRPPAQIEIIVEKTGKPRVADADGLEFNLSHSGALALIAVCRERPVGVDVEKVEPDRDLLALAERALGEEDVARVRAAAPAERAGTFFDAWVRHEARLKCLGVGLTGAAPEAPVAVRTLDPGPGYAAAVAVAGEELGELRRRHLPPG